ncbi:hypothetical protein MAR_013892, partial [Mya arenaria]
AQTSIGGICQLGKYCPEGAISPLPCPQGSYNITVHRDYNSCLSQYLVLSTTGVQTGIGGICQQGHYCPEGTVNPLPCPQGNYNNMTGQGDCNPCPAGYYCTEGDSLWGYSLCLEGFYCPEGTGRNRSWCPEGTFSIVLGLDDISNCQQFLGGKHCNVTNLIAPVADCEAGYFCTLGVNTSQHDGILNTGTASVHRVHVVPQVL